MTVSLNPTELTVFDGELLFVGADGNGDEEGLWVYSGTAAGAYEVGGPGDAMVPGAGRQLEPTKLTASSLGVVFAGTDASAYAVDASEDGLWVTNGTASGTFEIGGPYDGQVVGAFVGGLYPTDMAPLNDDVLFAGAASGSVLYGLWVTDGTAAGTQEIGGLDDAGVAGANSRGLSPQDMTALDTGEVLFNGYDSSNDHGLWVTNGSASGTFEIGGLGGAGITDANSGGLDPQDITSFFVEGPVAVFNGLDSAGDNGLWITNGATYAIEIGGVSDAGVADASPLGLDPSNMATLGLGADGNYEILLFNGLDTNGANGLWLMYSDAVETPIEVGGLADQGVAGASSNGLNPTDIVAYNEGGQGLFNGEDANGDSGLWIFDSTTLATTEIGGLADAGVAGAASTGLNPSNMVEYDGEIYFNGYDSNGDQGLWETNGTASGTIEILAVATATPGGSAAARIVTAGAGVTDFAELDLSSSQVTVSITASGDVLFSDANGDSDILEGYTSITLSDSTIAISSNVLTQTFTDGSKIVSTYNIVDEPFASTVVDRNASGRLTSEIFYNATGGVIYTYSGAASIANFDAYQAELDTVPGGFVIADSLPAIVADLSALDADTYVVALTGTSGVATLTNSTLIDAPSLSLTGSGTELTLAEVLGYAGSFSEGAGSTLSISTGDMLTLTGATILAGTTSGSGTLDLSGGGSTSIDSGAKISVSAWSLLGPKTSATLNENLGYSGTFSEAASDTLDLAGGYLTLTGADTFAGGTLDGSNRLYADGTTLITDGLTIAGTASLENEKTLTQSGGAVTVGDDAGNKAELYNASTGTYAIADDSGIGRGSSTVSFIVNAGIFKKTGGTGTSAIAASFSDTGTVTVSSGTLSFSGPTNSFAAAITGAGTVLFAGGSTALESGASASVAALSETGAGTALTIAENLSYGGAFAEGAGSTLSVGSGDALTLTGTTILAGTTSGAGALDLSGGGSASIDSGAKISVSAWSLLGSKTSATLNENLSYAGTFGEAASDTLDLAGGSLTLTGSDTFSGGTLNGSNRLYAQGTTLITDGLTIGGTASLENQKTLTQSGGAVTVGDNAGNKAELYNASTGTYAIADDSGIGRGSSTVSFIVNSGLFEKTGGTLTSAIAASFTDTGTVTVVSGTLSFSGPSNSFAGAITGAGTVLFAGGSTSLKSSASASVDGLSETGAGTTLTIAENFSYGGVFTEGAGSTLVVDSGDTLTLTGTTTLAGTTSGAGTLDLSGGGSSSIDSGAKISVSAWSLLGSKTGATLDENLGYAGTFGEAAGDTFDLAGGSLTLTGADTFAGGTIDGSNRLYAQGTTLITDGLTIGGTASLENQKTVTQSGGAVTVGDNAGNKAELYNASTGTYAIADDSGIGRGSSTASFIVNAGMFEKTGGTATSAIAPALTNTGTVLVSSGVLDLQGAVSGTGADTISGASTLEFDSTVASGQTIGFTGAGGTLDLGDPQGFSGAISGFDTVGSNDTLEIAAPWTYLSFSENTAGTQGTLTLANGASHISLTLLGDYTAANIVHKAGPGGSTLVTYT